MPVFFSAMNAMVKGTGLGKEVVYKNGHSIMTLW